MSHLTDTLGLWLVPWSIPRVVLPESKVETVSSGASGWPGREVTGASGMAFGVEALVSEVGPLVAQETLGLRRELAHPGGTEGPLIRAEELTSPSQKDKLPGVRISVPCPHDPQAGDSLRGRRPCPLWGPGLGGGPQ